MTYHALPFGEGGEFRRGFRFHSGSIALDLVATAYWFAGVVRQERLTGPYELDKWLYVAGLKSIDPGSTEVELAATRELREAIYRLATAAMADQSYTESDKTILNRWAQEPPPFPQFAGQGVVMFGGGVTTAFAAIAHAGIYLLCGEEGRIGVCANPDCGCLFVDTSRSQSRRWCWMDTCGNKSKVNAFNKRQRERTS